LITPSRARSKSVRNRYEAQWSTSAITQPETAEQRIRAGELYTDLALDGAEPASDSPLGPPTSVVYDLSTDEQGVVSVSFLIADQSTDSVGLFGSETRALIACMTLTANPEGQTKGSSAECPDYVDTLYRAYRQVAMKP
jgi:hypothetical protein